MCLCACLCLLACCSQKCEAHLSSCACLLCLLAAQNHFENEIASCRGFQSKVKEEAVALMPEEQFLSAPQGQDFLREQEERSKQQGVEGCQGSSSGRRA